MYIMYIYAAPSKEGFFTMNFTVFNGSNRMQMYSIYFI